MTNSILLDAALRYANADVKIFPSYGVVDGRCTCGNLSCANAGKHPQTPRGFKDATAEVAAIEQFWSRHPNANIGAPTGRVNKFVALDLDVGHGGNKTLGQLLQSLGDLPDTPTSITGSGGRHIFFASSEIALPNKQPIPGYTQIDFRGDGG
nr:bifunctional DNA primase/polymerase [Chloroflexota bacterium]